LFSVNIFLLFCHLIIIIIVVVVVDAVDVVVVDEVVVVNVFYLIQFKKKMVQSPVM
jgi:hypothetical protein